MPLNRNLYLLGGRKLTVRKSFSIFIAIVIISIVGVLFFSIDSATFDLLKKADRTLLVCAVLLVLLGWFFDALKFVCLSRAAGERLTFKQTLSVVWINYFGCAITPMQSGGGPFQIFFLYRNGVSVGKSIAITLVRTLQILFLLALVLPFALITEPEFLVKHTVLQYFVIYVIVFISVAGFLLMVSLVRPQWIKRWSNWLIVKMQRLGVIKHTRLLRAVRWVNREIDSYSTNIRLFLTAGKKWFIASTFVAVAHLFIYLSIMPCLILALGFDVQYMQCMLAEALLIFLLYFVPTPGASGAAEGGATAVFALFVPWNLAGIMAIAWRVISEYTGVALGTIITIRLLGWGGADEVMKEEKAKIDNNVDH